MSAILPLNWADKKNSLLLADFIAKHGAEYCLTAEEINQMRDAINEMAVVQQSVFMGSLLPSDALTGTGARFWFTVTAGTYNNHGAVIVSANSMALISVTAAGVFSVSQTAFDISGKVNISAIVNNLTSDSTVDPLSAAQGKALKQLIDDKSNTPVVDGFASNSTTSAGSANNDRLINTDINLMSQKTAQLLDKSTFIAGSSYTNSTGAIAVNPNWKRTPFIELAINTQYTVSGVRATFLGGLYNSSGVRITKLNEPTGVFLTEITFTTGTDNNFLGLNISDSENTNPNGYDNTALLRLGTSKVYVPFGREILGSKVVGDIQGVNLPALKLQSDNNTSGLDALLGEKFIYYQFNGTNSSVNLGTSYTLNAIGDFIEFEGWADATAILPNNGLGLFGKTPSALRNLFGFYSDTQIGLRENILSTYILWTIPGGTKINHKYKLEVVAGGWRLTVDDVVISTQTKTNLLEINNIGSNYAEYFFKGNLVNAQINTATNDVTITNFSTIGTNVVQVIEDTATAPVLEDVYLDYNPTGLLSQPAFIVYVRMGENSLYFTGYQVAKEVSQTRQSLYRIMKADLFKYVSGGMVSQSKVILTIGDSECVFQESTKTDATGSAHGDEIATTTYFYLDGVRLTTTELATAFTLKSGYEFSYEQVSTIYETDNVVDNPRCSHRKITTFGDSGYKTENSLTWLSVPNPIAIWYSGIVCVALATSGFYHPETLNYYTAGALGAKVNETGIRTMFFENPTNKLSTFVESVITKVKSGSTDNTKLYNDNALTVVFDDGSTRTKYYREVLNVTPAIGDIWESWCKVKHYENI